jgi:hypothetical protein
MNTKIPVASIIVNASTLNLLHTSWTQVLAALGYASGYLEVYNGSTTPIQIGVGPSGQEQALPYTIMGGGTNGLVAQNINAGSRITLKPVDSDITNGFVVINLFAGVT